jgi:hypothetical protein
MTSTKPYGARSDAVFTELTAALSDANKGSVGTETTSRMAFAWKPK